MQIFFVRSGGFMGSKLKTAVDTTMLPVEEAKELERVLTAEQLTNLPSTSETTGSTDQFNYELTVISGEWQHTAVFSDSQMTAELQPVIRRLTVMARQSPDQ